MIFENLEINIDELPKVETGDFQRLDSNYLVVSYIGGTIFFLFLGFGLLGAYFGTDFFDEANVFWSAVGLWIAWAIASFVLRTLGYRIRGYILRDKDIIHRKGVLFKSITTIPFNRVQHCEVSQGVIQRMFDLHTLQIFTAGGSNSDLSIPGLKADTAQRIKDFIINKTVEAAEHQEAAPMLVDIKSNEPEPFRGDTFHDNILPE
ncbi:MAG: PH domain-containing protein [Bacteroidota bacterium]